MRTFIWSDIYPVYLYYLKTTETIQHVLIYTYKQEKKHWKTDVALRQYFSKNFQNLTSFSILQTPTNLRNFANFVLVLPNIWI